MRRFSFFVVVLMAAVSVFAFTPPDGKAYGHDSNGNYWIAKSYVDAVSGQTPKLKCSIDGWKARSMRLDGNYYVIVIKTSRAGAVADFCFDIGGNRFLPHALEQADNPSFWEGIPEAEKPNNVFGGYNFRTKTVAVVK